MSDPTRLIAIRHGETAWNVERRLQGQLDIPLNALGQRQAASLAEALRDEGLQAVVASDLGRAWQTAQALAAPLGLPVAAEPGLRERAFGAMEGHTYEDIEARWPDWSARWKARDAGFAAPEGGESLTGFYARCVAAVERVALAHAGQAVALVCHGGVLDCLYRAATRLPLDAPRTWQLGNAAVNRLLHTPQGLTLVGWNDQSHLDSLARDEAAS
ncbi:histidine phosphatase family protein [Aquabacterium sp. OR-4]|uniref:histidine phosphatase family protein n=1 Tax=Aquabacterium sp. OR-4 TaxID=2978127 RepID=UPI0021B45253|nr:histidine phosphatase family protein [Aquabacterium sp. OR-4]MDT7834241.1 histidine phosphatase family protein [Aquabacterium sp. OR-4]